MASCSDRAVRQEGADDLASLIDAFENKYPGVSELEEAYLRLDKARVAARRAVPSGAPIVRVTVSNVTR